MEASLIIAGLVLHSPISRQNQFFIESLGFRALTAFKIKLLPYLLKIWDSKHLDAIGFRLNLSTLVLQCWPDLNKH